MVELVAVFFSAALINNFVLIRFLGICPYLGVSQALSSAVGMGGAVIFVMTLSSMATWLIHHYLLVEYEITYLQTVAFILVIATLVQFVEMVLLRFSRPLYRALGVYLPLITTNCAIMGLALLNITEGYNFLETIFHAIGAGVGFLVVLVLFAAMRERLEQFDVPSAMEGTPIALLVAALMSMAFMGFSGFNVTALLGG
ncbi:MAG: electron transport complex subunit RsxA [Clostridia bacterium]